jgi:hypothetical protein
MSCGAIDVESEDLKPLTLDYQTPVRRRGGIRDWWRRTWQWLDAGPDTLLGCLALFFAAVPVLFIGIGVAYQQLNAAGCVVFPLCVLSILFGVGALLDERGTSKTFPLISFTLIVLYVMVFTVLAMAS